MAKNKKLRDFEKPLKNLEVEITLLSIFDDDRYSGYVTEERFKTKRDSLSFFEIEPHRLAYVLCLIDRLKAKLIREFVRVDTLDEDFNDVDFCHESLDVICDESKVAMHDIVNELHDKEMRENNRKDKSNEL